MALAKSISWDIEKDSLGRFVRKNLDDNYIISQYKAGNSALKIARELGCSDATIRYRLIKSNIKLRSNSEYTKETLIDLSGQTFGNLTVLEQNKNPTRKARDAFWSCICKCGKTHIVRGHNLRAGITTSCLYCANPRLGYAGLPQYVWRQIKTSASRKQYEFTITIIEAWNLYIQQDKKCKLSGLPIKFAETRSKHMVGRQTTASLDRIDSSKGYTLDNCQWLHKKVNMMKQNLDQNEFIQLCTKIGGCS